jgi:Uma2 family endonuclease
MSGSDRVNPASPGLKLTYDDYLLFPDDGRRHELIDGEHYATPSPNTKHQRVSGNLFLVIGSWLEAHPIGRIFYAPFDVVFSNFDVVEPDLLYLSNERMAEVVTPQHVRGAPTSSSKSGRQAHANATRRLRRAV